MTDNRTTELLQELRDLACDIHAAEIIDHVHITYRGWTFDSQWLDSWHNEFDRIADELEQAIAATLGSGNCARCAEDMGRYADSLCDPLKERIAELLRSLENDWHIHASWDGLRKFWCIELTEDGVRMRDATHGTLTAEQVHELIAPHLGAKPTFDFGHHGAVWMADFQAIADELNAELCSGMCRDTSVDSSTQFCCSECECTVDVPLLWGEVNFCPSCGRKVTP